jgi:1-acyl-sn-glycerol-3-phosphate acyltransferase
MGTFVHWLGKTVIRLAGWKVVPHEFSPYPRCVMVAAPHTSNWDFVLARAAFEVLNIPVRFTIKQEWTRGIAGGVLRRLGAIAIDRRPKSEQQKPISYVDAMVRLFETHPRLVILITPEGTRSVQTEWKTGFYFVARNAGVPIALGYLDYGKKEAGVGLVFYPGDDMEADMRKIMDFYAGVRARYPEKFSPDLRYRKVQGDGNPTRT